jgi:carbon storage regulator
MLVLTRKTDQKIQIGRAITITILRVKRSSVKIGIEAPDDVPIVREELLQKGSSEETGQGTSSTRVTRVTAQRHAGINPRAARRARHLRAPRGQTARRTASSSRRVDPGAKRAAEGRSRRGIEAGRR